MIATCSSVIPTPITNSEMIATRYAGNSAKLSEPAAPATNATAITGFSVKRSTKKPAGIDITPYAIKKAKIRKPAAVRLTWKLPIISGTMAFRILVISEMTKNVRNTSPVMVRLLAMRRNSPQANR